MRDYDFYIKRTDTWPSLKAKLVQVDGTAIPLEGATVVFEMSKRGNRKDMIIKNGEVEIEEIDDEEWACYIWQEGDTDVAGSYQGEFVVTFSNGKQVTVPNKNDEYIMILIGNKLGD